MGQVKVTRWLFPVLVIVLIGSVVAVNRYLQPARPPQTVVCADLGKGCSVDLDGRQVTVGVDGELRTLAPFQVWVRADRVKSVQASFTMKGMDMGFNLYTLKSDAQGLFRARVTLPVCVTGRRDWIMNLDIDGDTLAVPFVTEL